MNVVEEIARRARPEGLAVVSGEEKVTFGELFARVEGIAKCLKQQAEWRPALRVGLVCASGVDYIVIALAILSAGGCFVPVPGELTAEEREELALRTALQAVIVGPGDSWRGVTGDFVWLPLRLADCVRFPEDSFVALNPAFIRFSSGTTGVSKGVVLSHESLVERITAANAGLDIAPRDKVLWMLPMAHHFAVSIVLYLYFGACTVLESSHLAADVLVSAEREGATVIYGAPFHFRQLAADRGAYRWPCLRLAVSTAAALDGETSHAFHQRFDHWLVQALGIIEVGLPLLNREEADTSPTAIGKPLPAYRMKLRNGELLVQGPGMFDAYLSPWQRRDEVCEDGWFATGDLAEIDATGVVFLRGRLKSVLNVGGMKVFPEEIERVLERHPAVQRSRAFGRIHSLFGQVPVAEVILHSEVAIPELVCWCRERLASPKVPVLIRVVKEIPLTASGKIRRV